MAVNFGLTTTGGHQTAIGSHILTLDVDTLAGAGQQSLNIFEIFNALHIHNFL